MSNIILTIDPGTTHSAYLGFDIEAFRPIQFGFVDNQKLRIMIPKFKGKQIICEGIQSYGMVVGKETFTTCIWIGRFMELSTVLFEIMYRKDVKLQLCQSTRAKDKNVRQALIDKFPATGGGKRPHIGTKREPGPLYGVSNHIWSALAIAVAHVEIEKEKALRNG